MKNDLIIHNSSLSTFGKKIQCNVHGEVIEFKVIATSGEDRAEYDGLCPFCYGEMVSEVVRLRMKGKN